MAPRRRPADVVLARLGRLRSRIATTEARLEALYAQRVEAFQLGRSIDPATGQRNLQPDGRPQPPVVTFPELAEAAGVSEEAIHKALKKARGRTAAPQP